MESNEKRSLLIEWTDPRVILDAVRSGRWATGLEMLRAMADGELPAPPIAALLGYGASEFDEGRAVFEGEMGEQHYNPMGVVHGGVAATLLDTALACAIHTRLPITTAYTTLELKVNYIRPVTAATGKVRAIGEVIHVGQRTATADGRLEDSEGRLLAHATTTCLLLGA